ncbi:zinc finger BED domain-containing protein 1-like [Sander lucioperca]|uniref:zinc finger BED domain-containing protein 1-like n=1 Tax=Sander lucioperca TaxID=283035 RepID=UPI00125DF274|nr:zinc finger BED domain-containing protein 1-like [Sander lucioperca]
MDDIVQLMGPVKMATTVMCEEDQPTLSVIAPLQAKLLKHLQPCEDDSTLVAEMKRVMADDLSTRYRGTQDALNIASALDPRFKELPYLEKEDREQVYTKLVFELQKCPTRCKQREIRRKTREAQAQSCHDSMKRPQLQMSHLLVRRKP